MQPPRPPDTGLPPQGSQQLPYEAAPTQPGPAAYDDAQQPSWPQPQQDPYPEAEDSLPERPPSGRIPRLLVFLLVLAALALVLRYQVFSIREVVVFGNRQLSAQQVARAAGADRGLFYWTIKEEQIRQAVNANRYLVFEGLEKVFPNKLHLRVVERYPFAFFTHLGVGYVLAQDGLILEQTRELKDGTGLMLVNGLAVWGQQAVGALPATTDPAQQDTLVTLLQELAQWGFETQVTSLDIAQSLNLSIHTRDGFSINLGDSTWMHAKIGTVATVVNALRREGITSGIIEAARPGEATYRATE